MIGMLAPLTCSTSRSVGRGTSKRNQSPMSRNSSATPRIAIVTGASSGIGLHTALGRARTEAARRFVAERTRSDRVAIAVADFSSLAAVRHLADEFLSTDDRLDLLVNNAGLMSPKYRLSADGFELTFAVNHLAPFLLTNLLLDRLKASAPARIVTVASEAHRGHRLNLNQLAQPHDWGALRAYGRSKLCNILFTRELAARLDGSG